jgi:NADPH-dependent curcumin reductase CurA
MKPQPRPVEYRKTPPGETVVVAAASGTVGSVVGQIGKIKGCRVVGIAGGERKCRFVRDELGFDACLDHRQPRLGENLKAACPEGIDIYFENVGGPVFDAMLPLSQSVIAFSAAYTFGASRSNRHHLLISSEACISKSAHSPRYYNQIE